MSARRGPYRKPSKLRVKELRWFEGDVVVIGRRRWIIERIRGEEVILLASNTSNFGTRWTTTLTRLPKKEPHA